MPDDLDNSEPFDDAQGTKVSGGTDDIPRSRR